MLHLDDGTLHRMADGEASVDDPIARDHLADCPACVAALERVRRELAELDGLLAALDHPRPRLPARAVVRAARGGVRSPRLVRRAAVVALVLGATGVAFAVPGSSLRSFAARLLTGGDAPPGGVAAPHGEDGQTSGVAVPAGDSLLVTIAPGFRGRVEVILEDRPDVAVRTNEGGGAFTVDAGRLELRPDSPAAEVDVRIPLAAPRVEVRIGERTILRKRTDSITAEVVPDARGRYVFGPPE